MKLLILIAAAATSLAAQTCPTQAVTLSQVSIPIGSNSVVKVPPGWWGGTFTSSNTTVAPLHAHTPTLWNMATGVTAGVTAITGTGWTAPNDATGCSLSAAQLTVTALSATAKEVLVFDWKKGIAAESNRYTEGPLGNTNASQNKVVRYNVDRINPIDFANGGIYYIRVKMGAMSTNDIFTWQINHWKGNLGQEGEIYSHINTTDLNFNWTGTPITRTFTLPIDDLVSLLGRPVWDWSTSMPMTIMGFLSNDSVTADKKLDPSAIPLDMRMTIVNVGAGGTFSGWPYWIDHGLGERTYDKDFPTPLTIDSPSAGATISGPVDINVTAKDNVGVTKVEISIDSGPGSLKKVDTLAPYSWRWNPAGYANGTHRITVKAYDMAAHTNSTFIDVQVGTDDPNPPTYPNPPNPSYYAELNADLPYTPGVCNITATNSAELTAALNSVSCGQTICVIAGTTYSAGQFVFNKDCGRNYVTLRPSNLSETTLPAKTRVTPKDVAKLAKISKPNAGAGPIIVRPNSSGFRMIGLEVTSEAGNNNFIVLGSNNSKPENGPLQTTPASVPHHLIVDRSYIHCRDKATKCSAGIRVDANFVSIVNSYIDEIHDASGDDQAILVINGLGPFLIRNNFLHSAGENLMYGGGDPAIRHVPSDSWLEGNYFWKDPSRKFGDPLYKVKNLFELKTGRRMKIMGNVFENDWSGVSSQYYAIVWKSSNQNYCGANNEIDTVGKNGYYQQTSDIEFAYNRISNIPQGFVFQRRAVCSIEVGTDRLWVHDNLITGLGSGHAKDNNPQLVFWAYPQQINHQGEVLYPRDVIFMHNTVGSIAGGFGIDSYQYSHLETRGNYTRNFYIHSNIYPGKWFAAQDAGGGTNNNEVVIKDRHRPTLVVQHNLNIASSTVFGSNPNYSRTSYSGLLDSTFRLVNPSQYPGFDGRPVGANITALENCIAGATSSWVGNCAGGPPGTSVRLEANGSPGPITVAPGASVKMEWFVTGATGCTADASTAAARALWNGAKSTSGGSQVINPTSSASYTLECVGPSAKVQSTVTVNTSTVGISAELKANGSTGTITIAPGAAVLMAWVISGATGCTGTASTPDATAIWAGAKAPSGGSQTINPKSDASYTIDCTNSSTGKTASSTVEIRIQSINLSARLEANGSVNPITVVALTPVKLEWFVQGATACEASASTPAGTALWNGAKSATGGSQTINPASTATYFIRCSNADGKTVDAPATVNIAGVCAWPPF
jgi:hypothetical protein